MLKAIKFLAVAPLMLFQFLLFIVVIGFFSR